MSIKRKALSVLNKSELLELGQEFGLEVRQRMSVQELLDVIAGSKRATSNALRGCNTATPTAACRYGSTSTEAGALFAVFEPPLPGDPLVLGDTP